jgi:hypothetical protein
MNELQELEMQHYLGRAKNALQEYLVHKLLFPKVYLDADWNGEKFDVLAIDRAGVGDVHGVRLVRREPGRREPSVHSAYLERAVSESLTSFTDLSGHFRYLAVFCIEPNKVIWKPSEAIKSQCLAADGVGRVGILYVDVTKEDVKPEVLLKPERFRSSKEIIELTDRFVAAHDPNVEFRE